MADEATDTPAALADGAAPAPRKRPARAKPVAPRRDRTEKAPPRRPSLSTPFITKVMTISTLPAQQVYGRVADQVIRSLYATDVILRIIGDANHAEAANNSILTLIKAAEQDLLGEIARLQKIVDDNVVEVLHGYSKPQSLDVEITSPQAMRFITLIEKFDALIKMVDSLWFAGEFDGKQKQVATRTWQRKLIRLGNEIIGLERRAREAAAARNMTAEVTAAVGATGPATVAEEIRETEAPVLGPAADTDPEEAGAVEGKAAAPKPDGGVAKAA